VEAGPEGEEAADLRVGGAVEDLDVGEGAGVGADDDVGHAVAVNVAGRHEDAAAEAGEGEEAADQLAGLAVEDLDVGRAALARAGDDIVDAVAVDVAGGH